MQIKPYISKYNTCFYCPKFSFKQLKTELSQVNCIIDAQIIEPKMFSYNKTILCFTTLKQFKFSTLIKLNI
jgi:hypothetical protein